MNEQRHSPLSKVEQAVFAELADPEKPPLPDSWADARMGLRMLSVARLHGVLPIVWRKLRSATVAGDAFAAAMADAGDAVALMAGHSLLLRHHARGIGEQFAQAGIPAAVVKGPVFAERLYTFPADRPFTDIDLLTSPENLAAANAALPGLGFVALTKTVWDKSDSNQEYKWGRTDNPNILIELHGNLVHYASFRRLLSYSYDDLLLAGDGDPTAPAALLMTAVIHAACGHKFHRLQFAVDIVQSARALPDVDLPMLDRAARSIGADLELAVALNLAGQIFDDRRTLEMARRFSSGAASTLSKRLISPAAIHNATSSAGRTSHLRRKAFRGIQLLSRVGRKRL
ncbi:MAG: nucleotidyltransferase family protein [Hyphomicrobiales bacterium]|nr:nucleotidyltransferase family protein [Hyphomicrobiales bacterium]